MSLTRLRERKFPIDKVKIFKLACLLLIFPFILYTIVQIKDSQISTQPQPFSSRSIPREECFALPPGSSGDINIGNINDALDVWADCQGESELSGLSLFLEVYSVNVRSGEILLPAKFRHKVLKWLGNDENLLKSIYRQNISSIFNQKTWENTLFNPIRGKRPGANQGTNDEELVAQLINETSSSCDFCHFQDMTAMDVFEGHRIESKFSVTSANVFKYDAYHGLVLMKQHNPLNFSLDGFIDWIETSLKWFRAAHHHNPLFKYPHFMWDILPKASASQVHPHAQVSLSPDRYYGPGYAFQKVMLEYASSHQGRNYFTELVHIYDKIGLSFHYGVSVVLFYLTPKKEMEIMILSEKIDTDFSTLLFHCLRSLIDDLHLFAFSVGMFLPPMTSASTSSEEISLPVILRLVDRGLPSSSRSDISAMELFAASNVNSDPFELMRKLKPLLENRLGIQSSSSEY